MNDKQKQKPLGEMTIREYTVIQMMQAQYSYPTSGGRKDIPSMADKAIAAADAVLDRL